jgi:hypothetical protein
MAFENKKTGEITWAGCVLRERTAHCVRIMSDVYTDCYYASVWDADADEVREIGVGTQEFGMDFKVSVDATPEVRAAVADKEARVEAARVAAWNAAAPARAAAAAKAAAKADRDAKAEVLSRFGRGDRVRVTAQRGRGAPPLGTEGKIIWEGHSKDYGTPRVGILDGLGEKHWTARGNVSRVMDNPPADGGWVAFLRAEEEAEAKSERIERDRRGQLEKDSPHKGEWVRLTSNHKTFGKVFWRGWKGDRLRIGFKAKKGAEPTWCGVEEVEVLSGNPSRKTRTTTVIRPSLDKGRAVEHPVDPSRVVDFPAPFCDIRKLSIADLGWVALSADGVVIATLPEDQAIALIG